MADLRFHEKTGRACDAHACPDVFVVFRLIAEGNATFRLPTGSPRVGPTGLFAIPLTGPFVDRGADHRDDRDDTQGKHAPPHGFFSGRNEEWVTCLHAMPSKRHMQIPCTSRLKAPVQGTANKKDPVRDPDSS